MLAFDDNALCSAVRSDYQALSVGVTDAAEISKIFDTIAQNALGTMRALMRSWNRDSPIDTVPPETLAACLSYLPLRDIIRVSHVSQAWRRAALTFPQLWIEISLPVSVRNRHKILQLALARSGALPLDVYYSPEDAYSLPGEDIDVASALAPHMHRIRNLDWLSPDQLTLCECPAPLLEYWGSCHLDIPSSFIGGGGSLRVLELDTMSLPVWCPALATVKELVVYEASQHGQDVQSYFRLFELLPRLESLKLCKLSAAQSQVLFLGALPPSSLSHIALGTLEHGHDLVPYFVAWTSDVRRTVELHMTNSSQVANVGRLLDGAVELTIVHICTTALMADGRSHSVGFTDDETNVGLMLLAESDCLTAVQSFSVPLELLDTFSHNIAALASVRHLTVYVKLNVHQQHTVHASHQCNWNSIMQCLPCTVRIAKLESILIEISCGNAACPPNSHDAAQLISQISAFRTRTFPPVQIKGFSGAIVASIDVSCAPERFSVCFVY